LLQWGSKKGSKSEKKSAYDKKLCQLLDEYTKVLIAFADNVGSKQLQDIRKGPRGDSVVLMGKNTLIRLCIKVHAERTGNNDLKKLGELLVVSRLFFPPALFGYICFELLYCFLNTFMGSQSVIYGRDISRQFFFYPDDQISGFLERIDMMIFVFAQSTYIFLKSLIDLVHAPEHATFSSPTLTCLCH
jgi:hypothetical protein